MERRLFVGGAGLAGILAAGAAPAVHAQAAIRWRLTSSFPKSLDTLFGVNDVFASRVKAMSGGKFEITTHPPGELVPVIKGSHVYLIDGSGYIFRAFHALPPLTRPSDGLPVGAVHGEARQAPASRLDALPHPRTRGALRSDGVGPRALRHRLIGVTERHVNRLL